MYSIELVVYFKKIMVIQLRGMNINRKSHFIALIALLIAVKLSSSSPIENDAQLVIKKTLK